jgi:hypothetical protein
LSESEREFPISSMVGKFIDRLAGLSPAEWKSIQCAISGAGTQVDGAGTQVEMLEASRNAAVALAVRDLISREQFELLYAPFLLAIPPESLEPSPTLD